MQNSRNAGRLLIVASIPEMIEVFLLPYARHMRSLGWHVDGMAKGILDSQACVDAFDIVHDINWSRSPLDPRNLITVPGEIREIVKAGKYDIVHVHSPVASVVTRFALRRKPRPAVVYTAHGFHFVQGGPRLKNFVFRTVERIAGPWTDELIVINGEDAEAAARLRLVPPAHLHHMPGIGVDLSEFGTKPADQDAVKAELGLPQDVPLVIMIAEFIPRKRHEDAINAFAAVWGDANLLLVGKGPLLEEMKHLSATLGISRRVHFLGYRDDVSKLLGVSDLLILPSLQEGLPRSVLEAMSMGVPIIGTDIRGTRDLLEHGAGVLIPVHAPAALAHAMNALLSNEQRRIELRDAALARVTDYDLDVLLEMHERLYTDLLEERRSVSMLNGDGASQDV